MQTRLSLIACSILLFLWACSPSGATPEVWIAEAPAGGRYTQINEGGETILPNGRIVRPMGRTFRIAPHPFGLALNPDGRTAVTANSGINPVSISILEEVRSESPRIRQIPEGARTDKGILQSVFMGLAISPDNRSVWAAGGQANVIYRFDLQNGQKLDSLRGDLPAQRTTDDVRDVRHGYLGDLRLSRDGRRLFVVDQRNFDLLIFNTQNNTLTDRIRVGRYPFGLALSPDESKVYVANVGMFVYSPIASVDPDRPAETALTFPPTRYLSEEMVQGIDNDTLTVPGLGEPNVAESFSVWTIDLQAPQGPAVTHKVKTGILVGEAVEDIPAVGGASPNSVVATEEYVFVSNGHNDCVSVISTASDTVIANLFLTPDSRLGTLRGLIPFGLALSPDRQRLYVAEAGINAVGIIDIPTLAVIGHLPVGWFPSKLAVSPDGRQLIVANAKGYGSGPNGGQTFIPDERGTYIGNLMNGSVTVLDLPEDEELPTYTQKVIDYNFDFRPPQDPKFSGRKNNPIPLYPGQKESPIKYLVFISKENRTYDQVFGQLPQGKGDSTLTQYGLNMRVSNRAGSRIIDRVDVMVNHLALARTYAIGDNFYVDADVSSDGHRWLAGTYPNEWGEAEVNASYGGIRDQIPNSKAPGNLGFVAANGSIAPEDYLEAGSIWEHLDRNGKSFFNFGAGIMFAPHFTTMTDRANPRNKHAGYKYVYNYPLNAPLFDNSSRLFPTYNTGIPEQFRVDMFIQEYEDRWKPGPDSSAFEELPRILFIYYGMDHGAGERPDEGYPFKASYMADNDLALGRTVEFLSHTPYWKNMAIIVTEDDAQDGRDHVDAHRSLLMVISPYAKKDYIGHQHYSFGSIFKTFWQVLGIPYLNQYDAGATDLSDLFTDQPDFSPYQALPVDLRIFDPALALDPLDEAFNWEAVEASPELDAVEDFVKSHEEGGQ